MNKEDETKKWAAENYGIPIEDVVWYNSGICYDRIGIRTKESADKVTAKVQAEGRTANGGMLDGMLLGGQTFYDNNDPDGSHYDITC